MRNQFLRRMAGFCRREMNSYADSRKPTKRNPVTVVEVKKKKNCSVTVLPTFAFVVTVVVPVVSCT